MSKQAPVSSPRPPFPALAALRRLYPAWTISRADDGFVAVHTDPETGDADDVVRADRVELLGSRLHATRHRR